VSRHVLRDGDRIRVGDAVMTYRTGSLSLPEGALSRAAPAVPLTPAARPSAVPVAILVVAAAALLAVLAIAALSRSRPGGGAGGSAGGGGLPAPMPGTTTATVPVVPSASATPSATTATAPPHGTATSTATLAAAAAPTMTLQALLLRDLPPTPTPDPDMSWQPSGIFGVEITELRSVSGTRRLWLGLTRGDSAGADNHHFLALYTYDGREWLELDRLTLEQIEVEPRVLQVDVEPTREWLHVNGGAGAHSDCSYLLAFDGRSLDRALVTCHSSGPVVELRDLNGDGRLDVIVNDSDDYVFYYASGVRQARYKVLRWTGRRLEEVTLSPADASVPAPARRANDDAVAWARAGLWLDAGSAAAEALRLAPNDETVAWNAAVINLHTRALRENARRGNYPLLEHLFYGDYAAALETVKRYAPAQTLAVPSALVHGTHAEMFEDQLTNRIHQLTSDALDAKPDLAAARFLQGLGLLLADRRSADGLEAVRVAAAMDPSEPYFAETLSFIEATR